LAIISVTSAMKSKKRKESTMRLTDAAIDRVMTQFEAQAIPTGHPLNAKLNEVFGDHTYFIDGRGLAIIERDEPDEDGSEMGRVVKLASWSDASQTKLAPHEREFTDVVVALDRAA
jgi:hypothetical protein